VSFYSLDTAVALSFFPHKCYSSILHRLTFLGRLALTSFWHHHAKVSFHHDAKKSFDCLFLIIDADVKHIILCYVFFIIYKIFLHILKNIQKPAPPM